MLMHLHPPKPNRPKYLWAVKRENVLNIDRDSITLNTHVPT